MMAGQTFEETLIRNTSNDGREKVIIPLTKASTTCRIKVEPVDNVYYALNAIDFEITDTIEITPTTGTIVVSKNPSVKNSFIVDFGLRADADKKVFIDVFDLSGKQVYSNNFEDSFDALIDLSSLSYGLYIVRVERGNEIFTEKVFTQ